MSLQEPQPSALERQSAGVSRQGDPKVTVTRKWRRPRRDVANVTRLSPSDTADGDGPAEASGMALTHEVVGFMVPCRTAKSAAPKAGLYFVRAETWEQVVK